MTRLGFVVNPIAGMGGRGGLKGTDDVLEEAIERGAEPRAPDRAATAMATFAANAPEATVVTAGSPMGEDAVTAAGLEPTVVYRPASTSDENSSSMTDENSPSMTDENSASTIDESTGSTTDDGAESTDERSTADTPSDEPDVGTADSEVAFETTAADTRAAVERFLEAGVDLVCFVGGDGTAVDVAAAIEAHAEDVPMLGVPAGVKIYSAVFGVTPAEAGRVAATYDTVERREVNDIDEAAYREGTVRTETKAVVSVPVTRAVQSGKQLAQGSVDTLAAGYARSVEDGRTYVFGPGGTVGAIESELGIEPSPLGVDVYLDGEVLVRDASEAEILETMTAPTTVVVSPIGGQGFIFGRGNHQLSPAVLDRADDIEVVASATKLDEIDVLRVDLDDESVAESLRGWIPVRTGQFTTRMVRVE